MSIVRSRRDFLGALGVAGGAVLCVGNAFGKDEDNQQTEILPVEDLMREHGVLRRVLLIYEALLGDLKGERPVDAGVAHKAASVIKTFIEEYHERSEEQHVFPRFAKSGELETLSGLLRSQHVAGRIVTNHILDLTTSKSLQNPQDRSRLERLFRAFIRMYRPHAAREDTVLFPAFHKLMAPKEYAELGDKFEDKERELFGDEGFEKVVAQVAQMEKSLGIYDLGEFTPQGEI